MNNASALAWTSQSIDGYETSHFFAPEGHKYQLMMHPRMPKPSATLQHSVLSLDLEKSSDPVKMKWQVMHPFHSRIASQLFPHSQQITTDMSEELVLMWTILQPTLDMPWRHTYAWHGQLDGLAMAIDDSDFQSVYWQFSKSFQGASISKALWSTSTAHWPVPKLQFVHSHCTTQSAQVLPIHNPLNNPLVACYMEPQNLQLQTGSQWWATQHSQYSPGHGCNTCRTTVALSASHTQKNTAHDWELQHPAELAKQCTPNTILGDGPSNLLAAILTFLGQNMGGSHFTADGPKPSSTGFIAWFHWWSVRKNSATPLKWCQRWVAAILQRFWDTAWDILAHRNIENGATWAWPAHTTALVLA